MNNTAQIINIELDYIKPSIILESDWSFIILFLIFIICLYVIKYFINKRYINSNLTPVELILGFGGSRIKYNIQRNYENLKIAHRIYIELITRKAAIPIDEENDVINEIYDSWYSLFKITREEIKEISGDTLQKDGQAEELIKMTTDILNKGLRPHLTQYQTKFRKWYIEELNKQENIGKSPQEIQRNFPEYVNLIESMKQVNILLRDYAEQLNKFILNDDQTNLNPMEIRTEKSK